MESLKLVSKTVIQVVFYYSWSISITFFNRWAFSSFHFPLAVTFCHMIFVFHAVWLYRFFTKPDNKPDGIKWMTYVKRVWPTGVSAALDIGLSNWSFVYITVSMYTMCKSTTIIFILVAAIIFKLEKPKMLTILVILLIALGLFLFNFKSTSFNLFGFILIMAASFFSGLRWVLAQILLQRDSLGLSSTMDFVYYVQPSMCLSMLPFSIIIEGNDAILSTSFGLASSTQATHVFFLIIAGATLALGLTFSEYLLLSNTSSITFSICGIFKEIVTLTLASTVGGDKLSWINIFGLMICLSGISLHSYLKYKKSQEEKNATKLQPDEETLINSSGSSNPDF